MVAGQAGDRADAGHPWTVLLQWGNGGSWPDINKFRLAAGLPGQPAFHDLNGHAFRDLIVEIDHIHAAHADTAITSGTTDQLLLRGAVDVNVAAVGISGFFLGACQPKDAADNRIAAGSIGSNHFASWLAAFKNHSGRQSFADFPGDTHFTQWGAIAGGAVPDTEFGGGNSVNPNGLPIFVNSHFLVGNADPKFVVGLGNGATGKAPGSGHCAQGSHEASAAGRGGSFSAAHFFKFSDGNLIFIFNILPVLEEPGEGSCDNIPKSYAKH